MKNVPDLRHREIKRQLFNAETIRRRLTQAPESPNHVASRPVGGGLTAY